MNYTIYLNAKTFQYFLIGEWIKARHLWSSTALPLPVTLCHMGESRDFFWASVCLLFALEDYRCTLGSSRLLLLRQPQVRCRSCGVPTIRISKLPLCMSLQSCQSHFLGHVSSCEMQGLSPFFSVWFISLRENTVFPSSLQHWKQGGTCSRFWAPFLYISIEPCFCLLLLLP